jgi:AcrR family transcriptional regulator
MISGTSWTRTAHHTVPDGTVTLDRTAHTPLAPSGPDRPALSVPTRLPRALLSDCRGAGGTLGVMPRTPSRPTPADDTLGPRARARLETTEAIKAIAREHLAADGPNLSLRAVARDLGVVSSAVYRYFGSRDELLTALIVEGYDSLGEAVEAGEATVRRGDLPGRWLALGRATRDWALEHPHEYALLYGSPVPGYAAPEDTIEPANRTLAVAVTLMADAVERGAVEAPSDRLPRAVRADVEGIAAQPGFEGVPPTVLARLMSVWAQLYGTVSFELFGRYTNAVTDYDAYFEHQLKVMSRYLGLSR